MDLRLMIGLWKGSASLWCAAYAFSDMLCCAAVFDAVSCCFARLRVQQLRLPRGLELLRAGDWTRNLKPQLQGSVGWTVASLRQGHHHP